MPRQPRTITFYRKRLPHWEVDDAPYFVTVCLHEAIPESVRKNLWNEMQHVRRLDGAPRTRELQNLFDRMDTWLHQAESDCMLNKPEVAQMVADSLLYHQRQGAWDIVEYVIMPNHLHLFFNLLKDDLEGVMKNFKRFTGREAGKMIELPKGRFWQGEWFDHWSRSDSEDRWIIDYIRNNPVKAGLVKHFRDWPYGSWADERLQRMRK